MENKKDIIRPYGNLDEVNSLSRLLSEQKERGRMHGYSFLAPRTGSLTVGDIAAEIRKAYEDFLAGNATDVTDNVLAGEY
ncbi:MAG: hypothetical protein MJ249_08125 [Kiritimatiellae bacterium]|nr:hypothetical protein [Kiritimatiellia bacterium]